MLQDAWKPQEDLERTQGLAQTSKTHACKKTSRRTGKHASREEERRTPTIGFECREQG